MMQNEEPANVQDAIFYVKSYQLFYIYSPLSARVSFSSHTDLNVVHIEVNK